MALTQIKTAGLADDAITSAKIADDAVVTAAIADDAVTGANIADDTVAEANMANDAISLAELKAGTDGQIISWDASGNPVAIGPGTDGQVLTSTGAGSPPAFEAASGGAALSNDANNRITTADGSGGINGEANLTFDGNTLTQTIDGAGEGITQVAAGNHYIGNIANADITSGAGYAVYIQTGQWDGNQIAQMRFICGDDTTNKDDGDIAFYTSAGGSSSEVLRLTQEKNVEVADGNVKFASGHGIDFSNHANAGGMSSELLNDYEEGTWTPADGGGIVGFANADGTYVKVGNMVMASFRLISTNSVTSTGSAYIVGLPFTHKNDDTPGGMAISYTNSTDDFRTAHINKNSTLCYFYKHTGANMTRAQMWDGASTSRQLSGTLCYITE